MPSPFPGMDPFLESDELWPDFHRQFVGALHQMLVSILPPRYEASLGRRQYRTTDAENAAARVEEFIDVHERDSGKLITRLDVVSPQNKTIDVGRQAYLATRQEGAQADANLAEIDLILQGRPTLDFSREALPPFDRAITVTRRFQPDRYELYIAAMQKRLPRFRLALAPDDRDVVLDSQTAFVRSFDQGRFAERIDYTNDPPVPLSEEACRWLDDTLIAAGLRAPRPSDEQVAVAAYYLWEREGQPPGRDREHWLWAVRQLRRQRRGALQRSN